MRGMRGPASERSRSAISTRIVAVGVVVVVLIASAAGYFLLLRPGSSTTSSTSTATATNGVAGNSQTHPVSASKLYQLYNLGANATDVPAYSNHSVYADGNLTAIINDPATGEVLTGMSTGGNDFEYWYWHNSTGLPLVAENQAVLAQCFVTGLVQQRNGTFYLYLKNCDLISLKSSNNFG